MKIAILTPTFNREKLLPRLYGTLLKQSDRGFVWIVVDDGSSDGTEQLVSGYRDSGEIEIRYFKKANGGKASALNYGFENDPDVDFFAVVDSDDWLNDDAVEIIRKKAEKYLPDPSVGAIFFKYTYESGVPMYDGSVKCLGEERCMTRYEHDSEYHKEDGCIGYFGRAVKKFRYPVFESERYMGPIVIQMMMADEYSIAFTLDVIGVAEYQEGGLSRSGRKLRIRNPLGMICYCGLLQSPKNKDRVSRVKYCVEAQAYASISKMNRKKLRDVGVDPQYLKPWAYLPGRALGLIWKKKYS